MDMEVWFRPFSFLFMGEFQPFIFQDNLQVMTPFGRPSYDIPSGGAGKAPSSILGPGINDGSSMGQHHQVQQTKNNHTSKAKRSDDMTIHKHHLRNGQKFLVLCQLLGLFHNIPAHQSKEGLPPRPWNLTYRYQKWCFVFKDLSPASNYGYLFRVSGCFSFGECGDKFSWTKLLHPISNSAMGWPPKVTNWITWCSTWANPPGNKFQPHWKSCNEWWPPTSANDKDNALDWFCLRHGRKFPHSRIPCKQVDGRFLDPPS